MVKEISVSIVTPRERQLTFGPIVLLETSLICNVAFRDKSKHNFNDNQMTDELFWSTTSKDEGSTTAYHMQYHYYQSGRKIDRYLANYCFFV